jgi:tetratricopeptide (TPR) repeat protein
VGIPVRFQSEATLLIGVILFSGSYFAQAYLPESYFKTYFAAGEKAYKKGQLREARENYEQALKIDGQESAKVAAIYTSLGLIDESLGNDNEAFKNYARALDLGDLKVLNNMARVKIYKGEFDAAETFLNLGIQKGDKTSISDQYQLYRNLGWTYLEKKRYAQAEEFLTKAIDFDKQIAKGAFGKGMANCFKAKVYELQERPDKAANQWNLCTEFGKPETFHEYQAILKINPEIGRKLDTTGIFQ